MSRVYPGIPFVVFLTLLTDFILHEKTINLNLLFGFHHCG
jgi:hypothetical protein